VVRKLSTQIQTPNQNDARLTAIFQENPGNPGVSILDLIRTKDVGDGGNNWSDVRSTSQIVTTNKPTSSFLQVWMPFLSPN